MNYSRIFLNFTIFYPKLTNVQKLNNSYRKLFHKNAQFSTTNVPNTFPFIYSVTKRQPESMQFRDFFNLEFTKKKLCSPL